MGLTHRPHCGLNKSIHMSTFIYIYIIMRVDINENKAYKIK